MFLFVITDFEEEQMNLISWQLMTPENINAANNLIKQNSTELKYKFDTKKPQKRGDYRAT